MELPGRALARILTPVWAIVIKNSVEGIGVHGEAVEARVAIDIEGPGGARGSRARCPGQEGLNNGEVTFPLPLVKMV